MKIVPRSSTLKFKMLSCSYLYILLLFSAIVELDTAKILAFYPTPSISHQITFYPLTNELVKRGHEVTVVTTDPLFQTGKTPENLTEINIHDVSYPLWNSLLAEAIHGNHSSITQVYLIGNIYTMLFEQQIKIPEVQKILKKHKNYFDLILVEACYTPGLILSHIFNAPLIQISSFGAFMYNLDGIGAPTHPFLYPTIFRRKIHNLSFWDKVKELHVQILLIIIRIMHDNSANEIIKKNFGAKAPTIDELRNNIHMLFLNVNPIWAGNIPVPPGLIYTGGIHIRPQKELPEDIKSYLDSSINGVIYISFGTNIKTAKFLSKEKQKFINVLSNLSYSVLWKWDQEDFPEQTKNIKISKWLPQSDLLRHPKIKLFITQGGQQSTDEAIVAGVPVIGVPMMADQWYNTEKYIHFKIGMKIDIESFTEDSLREAINTVINSESYRKNVEILRKQMYDQPQSSLDRGIWWIEYSLRHGGARHLRAPAANMSWAEYYELKLICFILIPLIIVIYILVKLMTYFWKLMVRLTKRSKLKIT